MDGLKSRITNHESPVTNHKYSVSTEIVVPGSVANLGGGFDSLAVAVQLYLRARIVEVRADGGARLVVGNSRPPVRGNNAIESAFAAIARRATAPVPSVLVDVESDIPMAAGLGSSAAAAVAGLRVFEEVTGPVPENTLLAVATSIEGHADNAAAALLGGLTSVIESDTAGGELRALRWAWPEDLRLIVATPFTGLATSKARAALAPSVSRKDAVFNLQRVLALVHALQHGDYERMREAMQDRWHQSVRAGLVPHLGAALAIDDPEVLGACLSGAGPSVALLARRDFARVERLLQATCEAAGSPVTVRTLAVHQSSHVMRDAMASAHGRT
jgi:homoserine kinase